MVSGISVVLPAYNEEENIGAVVDQALSALPDLAHDWEVIIVDDGSTDRTAEVSYELVQEHHPRVRLLRHPANRGYGAALRTGFSRARHDVVFYTDADQQFDIGELRFALPLLHENDVVVGFRVYRYDTVTRLVASMFYNWLVRLLFRVKVRDVDCSFKVFRREVLDKITIECDDFFADTELVAKVRKWNFRLVEKGVRHFPRAAGETSVQPSDIPRTLRTVLGTWQRIHMPTRSQVEEAARLRREVAESAVEAVPAGE